MGTFQSGPSGLPVAETLTPAALAIASPRVSQDRLSLSLSAPPPSAASPPGSTVPSAHFQGRALGTGRRAVPGCHPLAETVHQVGTLGDRKAGSSAGNRPRTHYCAPGLETHLPVEHGQVQVLSHCAQWGCRACISNRLPEHFQPQTTP